MKKLFVVAVIIVTVLRMNAQSDGNTKSDSLPVVYLGIGTGINNYTGLIGLSVNLRAYDKIFIQGGIGIGSWGTKMTIGLRYDLSYKKGWSFGVGISTCSGLTDFKTNLELQNGTSKDVILDLNRANTLNLKATYNFRLGKNNNFYLEFGYAAPLETSPWTVKDGSVLSSTSMSVMEMVAPGGILIGLGFTFGL